MSNLKIIPDKEWLETKQIKRKVGRPAKEPTNEVSSTNFEVSRPNLVLQSKLVTKESKSKPNLDTLLILYKLIEKLD